MEIIGWIRVKDRAACGGIVVEGDPFCISHGQPYAFQGAKMSCKKNCVIAEGYPISFLTNGKNQVIHGMKTSGQCPLTSTFNDVDGVGNSSGEEIPVRFVQDEAGDWIGKTNEGYDQHFILTDEESGQPLANRHYRMKFKGRTIEGKTDAQGKTEKVFSDEPAEVTIEIMPEGYTRAII